MVRGDFTLLAEDAREYISREYLDGLNSSELNAVRSLAVLSEIEVSGTVLSVGGHLPFATVDRGLILLSGDFNGPLTRLRFVHPGMGVLVLAASHEAINRNNVFNIAATVDSATGFSIVKRLRSLGNYNQARQLLGKIVSLNNWSSEIFSPERISATARILRRTGILATADLEARLIQAPAYLNALLTIPLTSLISFLVSTKRLMPNLYAASTQFLSRQESVAAIGVTCLRGHPHLLPEFLVICRRDIPLLAQALNHELQTPMNTKGIVDALISGPLGAIGLFLRNSQHELPQIRFALQAALVDQITSRAVASKVMTAAFPVIENLLEVAKDGAPVLFEAVAEEIGSAEGIKYLVRLVSKTNLRDILRFLMLVPTRINHVAAAIALELSLPVNVESISGKMLVMPIGDVMSNIDLVGAVLPELHSRLVPVLSERFTEQAVAETAKSTPLGDVTYVLRYRNRVIPGFHQTLQASLARSEVVASLKDRAIETPLSQIAAFIRIGEAALPFVRALDQEWLAEKRRSIEFEPLIDICLLVAALRMSGRDDLAAELASYTVLPSHDREWRRGFMFLNLGTVVHSLDSDYPAKNLDRFLEAVCTDTWLRSQVQQSSTGVMAATLFRLWSRLPSDRLERFRAKFIQVAIRTHLELALTQLDDAKGLATILSLVGVVSLLGFSINPLALKTLGTQPIEAILLQGDPPIGSQVVTVREVQLWLGVREVVRKGFCEIQIDQARGENLLRRWRLANVTNEKYSTLNCHFVAWLETCAINGWKLVRE